MKRRKFFDPSQTEFPGVRWQIAPEHKFRLRAGDVIRIDGRLARVIRVNACAAVVIMNRPVREFTTRFDRHVRFQPPPAQFRISPNSETQILHRFTP